MKRFSLSKINIVWFDSAAEPEDPKADSSDSDDETIGPPAPKPKASAPKFKTGGFKPLGEASVSSKDEGDEDDDDEIGPPLPPSMQKRGETKVTFTNEMQPRKKYIVVRLSIKKIMFPV